MANQTNSSKSQWPKFRIFLLTQKNFATLGVTPDLSNQQCLFNKRISIGLSLLGLATICIFQFFFYEAKTFSECTQASYLGLYSALILIGLLIVVIKVKKLFEFIKNSENLVNTSKWNSRILVIRKFCKFQIFLDKTFQH